MLSWLRSLVAGRAAPPYPAAFPPAPSVAAREPIRIRATAAEVDYVRDTFASLERAGLVRNPRFDLPLERYTALLLEGYDERDLADPDPSANRIVALAPFPALATLMQLSDEEDGEIEQRFENLRIFPDHCYDGATAADYEELIGHILALAARDWQVEGCVATMPGSGESVEVALTSGGRTHRFSFDATKDLDGTLFAQLNGLAAARGEGRFGYAGDGGVILVTWLPLQRFASLNGLLGLSLTVPTA